MKIVQVQYSTFSAASSALRLNNAFSRAGINSKIISLRPDDNSNHQIDYLDKRFRFISKLNLLLHNRLISQKISIRGQFTIPIFGSDISKLPTVLGADIIYLHWVLGGFLNLRSIEKIAKLGKPIVIFLHDMWMITGGCHHSFDCAKYMEHCERCPLMQSKTKRDWAYLQFYKKKKLFSKYDNIYFVSPSKWLYDCALKSEVIVGKKVFHIPNIVEESHFKPFDKKIAKRIFNIDEKTIVISFGATSINSPYKGWKYLQEALEKLSNFNIKNEIILLIFGSGITEKIISELPYKIINLGRLKDDYSTVLVYNAADIFVAPSLADVGPMTVVESLKCQTPVVGFKVGGIPDIIRHKENGYLARYKDSDDLAQGILFCIENNLKIEIDNSFYESTIVSQHIELINSLI